MRLPNKCAVLVGASGDMGQAIGQSLAAEGATVACLDPAAETAAAAIGGNARPYPCDVTAAEDVRTAFRQSASDAGAIDILVYNAAAYTPSAPIADLPLEEWDQAMAVNLTGAFVALQSALPAMRDRGGSIIFIASQLASVGLAGSAAYCATKGGLVQLAKSAALECAADNIRINTVSPGGTATSRLARRFGSAEQAEREWGPRHPLGRLGHPEEIAAAVTYLATDDASFVTGANLLIDGGYTAQ